MYVSTTHSISRVRRLIVSFLFLIVTQRIHCTNLQDGPSRTWLISTWMWIVEEREIWWYFNGYLFDLFFKRKCIDYKYVRLIENLFLSRESCLCLYTYVNSNKSIRNTTNFISFTIDQSLYEIILRKIIITIHVINFIKIFFQLLSLLLLLQNNFACFFVLQSFCNICTCIRMYTDKYPLSKVPMAFLCYNSFHLFRYKFSR